MMNEQSGWQRNETEFRKRRERWSKLASRRKEAPPATSVECRRQDWGSLTLDRSIVGEPLKLGDRVFKHGFGTHANSEIALNSPLPIRRFRAVVGVDRNPNTECGDCRVTFAVEAQGKVLWQSPPVSWRDGGVSADIALPEGTMALVLTASADFIHLAHADWCEPTVTFSDGTEVAAGGVAERVDLLPVSFRYGGISSEALLPAWGFRETQSRHEGFSRRTLVSRCPEDGFEVTFTLDEYDDLPVSLWRIGFANTGGALSRRLDQVCTIDLPAVRADIRYARGGFNYDTPGAPAFRDDFKLELHPAVAGRFEMAGVGGRSSVDYMPYFNMLAGGEGALFAIGWTGQWRCAVQPVTAGVAQVTAGMEFLDCVLEPGEAITQPSTLLVDYLGEDFERGQNILRRFFMTEWIPEAMRQAPLTFPTWGGMEAHDHIARAEMLAREELPYEGYWIDAGWFGEDGEKNVDEFCTFWGRNVGNWKINPSAYPGGFRPVSDAIHRAGMKFMLWIEPERAAAGSALTLEHPEYFYQVGKEDSVLNLGNPEAEKWMLELVSNLIEREGVDWYRQDFNISPLKHWLENDAPGRTGISEIRHIEALYRIFDSLLARFPGMLIDNCASGGRRLDLEMMRRSIPLWASDMQCMADYDTEESQALVAGLNCWLPVFTVGTQHRPGDTYNFRGAMTSGAAFHMFMYEYRPITADFPYDWQRRMIADLHRVRPCMTGDYYLLTRQNGEHDSWQVMQFDRPDLGEGVVIAFRRSESPFSRADFRLRGLDVKGMYEVTDIDDETAVTRSAKELLESGLPIDMPSRRQAKIFIYRRKG